MVQNPPPQDDGKYRRLLQEKINNLTAVVASPFEKYFDPLYRVVNSKKEKSQDEEKFIQEYKQSFLVHMTSLLSVIPTGYYLWRFNQESKKIFGNQRKFLFRVLVSTTLSVNMLILSSWFDRNRLKQEARDILNERYKKQVIMEASGIREDE